MLYMCINNQY